MSQYIPQKGHKAISRSLQLLIHVSKASGTT